MSGLRQVDPGWLSGAITSARRRLHVRMTPHDMIRRGMEVTLPLPAADAAQLFADLNGHFYQWTGSTLAEYVAAAPAINQQAGREG